MPIREVALVQREQIRTKLAADSYWFPEVCRAAASCRGRTLLYSPAKFAAGQGL
ncbi:hypothetical protein [Bosea sp. Leaf344]|uniref:hypothetical protein n=1 Tax=Bosea sp. Leaf344 TaxID=1736346 RepID=UPI0012E376DA|nr:hypothetical protein [Bosea sp. Leaf344]